MRKVDDKANGVKNYVKLFTTLHVTLNVIGDEAKADECPFCGGSKFSLNIETGQYQCLSKNKCGEKGNAFSFIRYKHKTALAATTDEHRRHLRQSRGFPLQTIKRHQLAWDSEDECWLIPFKSPQGEVVNLLKYWPESGDKRNLPELPMSMYGLDRLSNSDLPILVCEGPLDAIALDQHLRSNKTRDRYDVIAVPSAGTFKASWLEFIKGRTVRLCFDNDKAGKEGQERIVKLCRDNGINAKITVLTWPTGTAPKYDLGDLIRDGGNVVDFTKEHCIAPAAGPAKFQFTRGDKIKKHKAEWLWDLHVPFGQFVSFSGLRGHGKSTVCRDLAARATAGKSMPFGGGQHEPFDVIYFTSEDSGEVVADLVREHGGDATRLHVHDQAKGDIDADILDHLDEIGESIKSLNARLVIFDALNSFAEGNIKSDSKARKTLSGKLTRLARSTGACVIGIRNWGRDKEGTSSQKALGATSLSDVARCTMNTDERPGHNPKKPKLKLEFERVSDARLPEPLHYTIIDKSGGTRERSHLRKIVWKKKPKLARRKKVAKKGSKASILT